MKHAPRAALLFLACLAGCVHYPVVVPSAFNPPPKRLAVIAFHADRVRGVLLPVNVVEVQTPLQAFLQALYASERFVVADPAVIAANPLYQQLATSTDHVVTNADPLRPILVDREAAVTVPALCQALAADVLVIVHFSSEKESNTSLGPQLSGSAYVTVWTDLVAWDARGAVIWRDQLTTDSPSFSELLGMSGPGTIQHAAVEAIDRATQQAVSRLVQALAPPAR